MALAEDTLEQSRYRLWLVRLGVVVLLVALVAGLTMLVRSLTANVDGPKRQIAKISILPDTPPPPPPPPREEPKKPAPRDDPKQPAPQEQPKPQQAPPADAPIKMDGPAGDGPSAFGAGAITQDYKGGAPAIGGAASAAGTVVYRAQERFYANSVRQLLRDEIERQLRPEAGELTATFSIWVEPDGRIRRHELAQSGDATRDADMTHALDNATRTLRLPVPGALPQPLRFRLTVRSQG